MNIEIKSGNTKIKQLKDLNIYCKYHKEGNKYIIDQIYENPKLKLDDILKSKNNKYIKLLSNIILEYLYNNSEDLKEIPLMKLFSILGITNDNYYYGDKFKKELSQLYNVQLASIYYFYSNTKNEYKKIIERCLNNLQNRSVLFWDHCIMIIDKENNKVFKADKEFKKEILNTQKEVLQYLNYNNLYELFRNKKDVNKFNQLIKKEIGYNYYFAYDITIGDKAIEIEYNSILKSNINNLIIDRTETIFNKGEYKYYSSDYRILIDTLINENNNNNNFYNTLKEKQKENNKNYKKQIIEAGAEYQEQIYKITKEYKDIYNI